MKEPLLKVVKDFLDSHLQKKQTFVLAFSGGVDSSALLSLLGECRSFLPFDLHVAHFDHAWREESGEQVLLLKKQVEALGLPFHAERSLAPPTSNKEEKGREERYQFLKRVYEKVGAEALFLAHQRDDQSETVLKRVLEGSSLTSLKGMEPVSFLEGMCLVRPLLQTARSSLIDWNKRKRVPFLEDYTNHDLHFLRPRMREKIFPYLEEWFGKGVQKNLSALSEEFLQLKGLLQKRVVPFLEKKVEGSLGAYLPLEGELEELERKELIRHFLKEKGVTIGKSSLKEVEALRKKADRHVDVSKGDLVIDSDALFWFPFKELPTWSETGRVSSGVFCREGWTWTVEKEEKRREQKDLLSCFLKGEVHYAIPEKEGLCFCPYDLLEAKEKKRVASFFSKNKVPARIRKLFPFVIGNEGLIDLWFLFNLKTKTNENNAFVSIILNKVQN